MFHRRLTTAAAAAACIALASCGGGGGSSGTTSGGTIGGGGGSLPCASGNLCIAFDYEPSTPARMLAGSISPDFASELAAVPAHFTLTAGTLPPGMSLNASTGVISGTPTTNGIYSPTVQLSVSGYSGTLTTQAAIEVLDPTLTLIQPQLSIGTQGFSVLFDLPGTPVAKQSLYLNAEGNSNEVLATPAYGSGSSFAVIGTVPMPPGLSLDTATGAITGTPTQAGVWIVQVQANIVSTSGSAVFTGYAAISVGALIQEQPGQAATTVQVPIHAPAGLQYTTSIGESVGNPNADMTFDATTQIATIEIDAIPADATPGTYPGAFSLDIGLPQGAGATLGYVETVN
jgi:hypothetical protein